MKYKVFKEGESFYTHLLQTNPYIHTLYQLSKLQFIFFIVYIVVRDSYNAGRPWLDLTYDAILIGDMTSWLVFLVFEAFQLLLFLLLYPVFMLWKTLRIKFGKAADYFYGLVICSYVAICLTSLCSVLSTGRLCCLTRVLSVLECFRLLGKTVSFIYENGCKVLYPWCKDDERGPAVWYAGQMSPKVASFPKYLYFLFAPTLVYRDNYPRNKGGIRWKNVTMYLFQMIMIYSALKLLFIELTFPKSLRIDHVIAMITWSLLASPITLFMASLLVLHGYLNLFAELLRFGDRRFHTNWWCACSQIDFHKMWNIPIYDFNTSYAYPILVKYFPKAVAGLVIFFISALMHDVVVGAFLGFFMPVFLVYFALGGGFIYATNMKFTWCKMFLINCFGFMLLQSTFYLEVGARYYCQDQNPSYVKLRTPHCFLEHNSWTQNLY